MKTRSDKTKYEISNINKYKAKPENHPILPSKLKKSLPVKKKSTKSRKKQSKSSKKAIKKPQKLKDIYYNLKDIDSFGSIKRLHVRTKKSKDEVKNWLSNQLSHSLNKPIKRKFPTRSYKVNAPNGLWQIDLLEMIPYANINNNYKYIMNVIDIYSRYVWSIPLKTKTGIEVSSALKTLFKHQIPHNIQTDLGKEFYNIHVDKLFKEYNINHYTIHSQYKAAIVERFNRTLRSKLSKYFIYTGKKEWYNILNDIIHTYNKTNHGGIENQKPIDLFHHKNLNVWFERDIKKKYKVKKSLLKVNDYVRISRISISPFIKNFNNNWSDEVFQIAQIDNKDTPTMYTLKDFDGNVLKGKFYIEELQYLPKAPSIYRIEQILETEGRGKHKQHLVKWVGYKNPTWIKATQISS